MQKISDKLVQLVDILDDQQYHDGTSIGNSLNITRAAVWKYIKKLIDYDVQIESVKGKGYLLKQPMSLLNAKKIKDCLSDASISVSSFEKITSTNEYLKTQINDFKQISVCLAEMQEQGKGRFNRQWHSPFGKNIYCSVKYPFQKDVSELAGLSLVISLAVSTTIEESINNCLPVFVKWPNDIIIADKKVSGSLVEITAESNGFSTVIVGVGLNVNMMSDHKKQIDCQWTSLQRVTNTHHDRNHSCAILIKNLIKYLKKFEKSGLKIFYDEWTRRDYLLEKRIGLLADSSVVKGKGRGINSQGHLVLVTDDDQKQAFSSGDTTVLM